MQETSMSDKIDTVSKDEQNQTQGSQTNTFLRKRFTTGQLSTLCGVAPRTVVGWCTTSRLKYIWKPKCRRSISREDFIEFLQEQEQDYQDHVLAQEDTWETILAEAALVKSRARAAKRRLRGAANSKSAASTEANQ
jgi:hypothetical protein